MFYNKEVPFTEAEVTHTPQLRAYFTMKFSKRCDIKPQKLRLIYFEKRKSTSDFCFMTVCTVLLYSVLNYSTSMNSGRRQASHNFGLADDLPFQSMK